MRLSSRKTIAKLQIAAISSSQIKHRVISQKDQFNSNSNSYLKDRWCLSMQWVTPLRFLLAVPLSLDQSLFHLGISNSNLSIHLASQGISTRRNSVSAVSTFQFLNWAARISHMLEATLLTIEISNSSGKSLLLHHLCELELKLLKGLKGTYNSINNNSSCLIICLSVGML